MNEGKELWEKYCGFFDKSFSEQMEYNESKKDQYFEEWKNTKMAKQLCPEGVAKFEDIPLTTYDDYPILHEFGKKVEHLSETVPRGKGEFLWDYYERISRKAVPMLDGWMADEYGFCCKTSGTSGESKWFAHGRTFVQNASRDMMAMFALCCSDKWGRTRLRRGDKLFLVGGTLPYIGGLLYKSVLDSGFRLVPPLEVSENITNMRKKLVIALKMIEKGERVDAAGGIASSFHMACRYFVDRPSLYRDYYQSMKLGVPKIVMLFMWFYQGVFGKRHKKIKEIMDLKGITVGGFDTRVYVDFLREQFELEPRNGYGATECGFILLADPNREMDLMPVLQSAYFEFLAEDGETKRINELERGEIYELVSTPFRSVIMRYKMGDLFRVADFRDDGLPIFDFQSRKVDLLDIRNYFRLSGTLAVKALSEAEFPPTDKWAFAKEIEPEEHLCLLMEREWEYSEEETAKRVFEGLRKVDPYFQNYVRDFGIRDPGKVIRVEYLKKGAFMRYIMLKAKQGVPMGQIKPLKLITPQNKEIADLLRRI